jgi:hypothetical protein
VPDWRICDKAKRPLTELSTQLYNAIGNSYFHRQRMADARKLLLQGLNVDTIVTLKSPRYSSQWESFVRRLGARYEPTDHSMLEAYVRTLVVDLNPLMGESKRWTDEEFV